MKHLKTKLVSAIAMLAVAAIMMTSATYAWFTISTNPIVKGANASVTANGNLEIALDNGSHETPDKSTTGDYGKNTTWGNTVDVSKFFNDSNLTLKPVQAIYSSALGTLEFSYPVYGKDGRIKRLDTLTRVGASTTEDANVTYDDLGGVAIYTSDSTLTGVTSSSVNENSSSIYAFEIDYWLRTNKSSAVLELKSSAVDTADNMNAGSGSVLSLDNVTVYITMSSASADGFMIFEAVRDSNGNLSLAEQDYSSATLSTVSGGKTSYSMPQNSEVEVRMFVFMDGVVLENADALQTLTDFTLDIQFTVGDLNEMVVTPDA